MTGISASRHDRKRNVRNTVLCLFCYRLFLLSYGICIVLLTPKFSISILIFQVCVPIEYPKTALAFLRFREEQRHEGFAKVQSSYLDPLFYFSFLLLLSIYHVLFYNNKHRLLIHHSKRCLFVFEHHLDGKSAAEKVGVRPIPVWQMTLILIETR